MRQTIKNFCIANVAKAWVLFMLLLGSRAFGQSPSPPTDHIKTPTCSVKHNNDYSVFELHFAVTYTDEKPYWGRVMEINSNPDGLFDQCERFLNLMSAAQTKEKVIAAKADAHQKMEEAKARLDEKLAKK